MTRSIFKYNTAYTIFSPKIYAYDDNSASTIYISAMLNLKVHIGGAMHS